MRKALALWLSLLLVATVLGCATKDEEAAAPVVEEKDVSYYPESCQVARIKVTPELVSDSEITIGSGREIQLEATAIGHNGQALQAALTWSLRYPDADDESVSGHGHKILAIDNNHAVFRADGLAPGLVAVQVQDRSCNQYLGDQVQHPEGAAWINVYNRPEDEVACGRMRITYGDEIDRMGDKVLASAKATLVAELSARQKLDRMSYRVKFYLNDKPYLAGRPAYFESTVDLAEGMEAGHMAYLSVFITPGAYGARYELLKDGQVVCASRTERFTAK